MKFFKVAAKCGRVGENNCVIVNFACVAENGKDAVAKVKEFPRVKRNLKDAILGVKEITLAAFMALKIKNDTDPYLHCMSRQEEREKQKKQLLTIRDIQTMCYEDGDLDEVRPIEWDW